MLSRRTGLTTLARVAFFAGRPRFTLRSLFAVPHLGKPLVDLLERVVEDTLAAGLGFGDASLGFSQHDGAGGFKITGDLAAEVGDDRPQRPYERFSGGFGHMLSPVR